MWGMWLVLLILTFHLAKIVEIGTSPHSCHTVKSVCICSLSRWHQTLLSLLLSSVCSWSKVRFIYKRRSQLEVRSCANVLCQSCKQNTAGFGTDKCAVGILWAIHWPVTCHSWLSALVVVGAQNYKSKQEQMDVVSLNTTPEKWILFIFIPLAGLYFCYDT